MPSENGSFDLLHVLHEDDRVLTGIVEEQFLKVRAARRQHDLVTLEHFIFACQSNVDEMLRSEQLREGILQVRLVTVPTDAKLLRRCNHLHQNNIDWVSRTTYKENNIFTDVIV